MAMLNNQMDIPSYPQNWRQNLMNYIGLIMNYDELSLNYECCGKAIATVTIRCQNS